MGGVWESKRVCVTGGGGFLGGYVVEALRARGCRDVFVPRKQQYRPGPPRGRHASL